MFVYGHYDGHQIQLDEPVNWKPNTKVRIENPDETEEEFRQDWAALARHHAGKLFERDEQESAEPEYGLELLKWRNPLKH